MVLYIMGFFGNLLGTAFGSLGSHLLPIAGVDGGKLGGTIGNLLPFSRGGRVGHRRVGRPRKHRGKKRK
jgi:hypothetical protein